MKAVGWFSDGKEIEENNRWREPLHEREWWFSLDVAAKTHVRKISIRPYYASWRIYHPQLRSALIRIESLPGSQVVWECQYSLVSLSSSRQRPQTPSDISVRGGVLSCRMKQFLKYWQVRHSNRSPSLRIQPKVFLQIVQ